MSLETFMRGETKMTNPISKAIVKAAVAMGYGKKSDYKGSTVSEVLEKFASIAKDKGGSGGGNFVIGLKSVDSETGDIMLDKTAGEIVEAMQTKNVVVIMENGGTGFYFDSIAIAKMLVGGQEFFSFDFGRLMSGQATGINEYPVVKVNL